MKPIDYLCTAIRSVGSSFPVASSVVNGWNEIQGRLELEKVHKYIEGIAEKLEKIDGKVSRNNEESAIMFHFILNYIIKDPELDKTPVYAGLLIEYCTTDVDKDLITNIVQELETLLPFDIKVLQKLRKGMRVDESLGINDHNTTIDISKYHVAVKKLESKALIGIGGKSGVQFHRVYDRSNEWPYTFLMQHYQVLHQGVALLNIWDKYYRN